MIPIKRQFQCDILPYLLRTGWAGCILFLVLDPNIQQALTFGQCPPHGREPRRIVLALHHNVLDRAGHERVGLDGLYGPSNLHPAILGECQLLGASWVG